MSKYIQWNRPLMIIIDNYIVSQSHHDAYSPNVGHKNVCWSQDAIVLDSQLCPSCLGPCIICMTLWWPVAINDAYFIAIQPIMDLNITQTHTITIFTWLSLFHNISQFHIPVYIYMLCWWSTSWMWGDSEQPVVNENEYVSFSECSVNIDIWCTQRKHSTR